jgi:hypothetical protein
VFAYAGNGGPNSGSQWWSYVGGVWTNLTNGSGPPTRNGQMMTYDAADGFIVLFGGLGFSSVSHFQTAMNDLWKWSAGAWTQVKPTTSPLIRTYGMMTYDGKDGYVLLFGGLQRGPVLNDTWKFVAGSWTKITTGASPPARYGGTMTFDTTTGTVVLFGGLSKVLPPLVATWVFSGGSWTQLNSTLNPVPRWFPGLSYDSRLGSTVLFGGGDSRTVMFLNDTWELANGSWHPLRLVISPLPRDDPGMAYDPTDGYMVVFGGVGTGGVSLNDTWVLR